MHTRSQPLISLIAVALLLVASLTTLPGTQAAASTMSVDTLTRQAADSLRAEYQVLVSGEVPRRGLTPRVDEFGASQDGAARTRKALARRSGNAHAGLSFTSAEVELSDVSVLVVDEELRLNATERVTLAFRSVNYVHNPARDRMVSLIGHTFVFVLRQGAWTLVRDDVERFPLPSLGEPIPAPGKPAESQPRTARENAGGRLAAPLRAGWYDWPAAQNYIRMYALNPNPAYRTFTDDRGHPANCTNFVSQVLRAGGWVDRLGWYRDWNNWWYNDLNQTQSWTYTHAFQQFFSTSGRGQFLSYLVDLWIGDVIQVDFDKNGSIDHAMVVNDKVSSTLDGIFISYHTTNTYNRPLSDFLTQKPMSSNTYWAMRVIGTHP